MSDAPDDPPVAAATRDPRPATRSEPLTLRDGSGQPRASLEVGDDGAAALTLRDRDGKPLVPFPQPPAPPSGSGKEGR